VVGQTYCARIVILVHPHAVVELSGLLLIVQTGHSYASIAVIAIQHLSTGVNSVESDQLKPVADSHVFVGSLFRSTRSG